MEFPYLSKSMNIVHPICIERGFNAEVWDIDDRRYLDFIGGIGVLNLGHCHPEVVDNVSLQARILMHSAFNAVPHKNYLALLRALNVFVPLSYEKSFILTNSGSESTENALKMARAYTSRQAVIAFDDGFHGRTLTALNLNGKVKPYKVNVGLLPGNVYHIPFPSPDSDVSCQTAMAALERIFQVEIPEEQVAAIIVEPVQGEGGFRKLDTEFALWLREKCTTHGIVLIFDEIQSGFGRTGRKFAFSGLGVEPDLLLMGKSMANGLPISAVAGKSEIMNALPAGGIGGTYSGNAVACAAALAVIDAMTTENLVLWGGRLEQKIIRAHGRWTYSNRFPMVGKLTGTGCMRGITFTDTANATGAQHLANLLAMGRSNGILLMPSGRDRNVLRLLPPLTTPPEHIDEGLTKIEQVLETFCI